MGVLEDAIRDHLELKRKHGVSDEELRRQEDEALGPARRETPVVEMSDDGEADVPVEGPVEEPPVEEPPVEEPPSDEPPVAGPPVEPPPPVMEPEPSSADFVEDPPEQDRLSFEERPRRDLDFD